MGFLSRRQLMQSAAAAAAAAALPKASFAQAARPSAVVLVYLNGGYNALFGSAGSFTGAGTFGCSAGTMHNAGNGLFVDKPTYGTLLPSSALQKIATVGVNHRISSHQPARLALWSGTNERSYALMLAKAMGGGAGKLPAVVVGRGTPEGKHPVEGGISLQRASDLAPTLDLFGVSTGGPVGPTRRSSLAAMRSAKSMSATRLADNPNELKSAIEAYDGSINVLTGAPGAVDYAGLSAAYGVTGTAVNSFTHQMLAAETMIRLGSKVVVAVDNSGWDSHGDLNGSRVRGLMTNNIMPGLSKFLGRMLPASSGYDVTVAIFGDFARSLPGSDHASCLAATVIGSKVRVGTTGVVDAGVAMQPTTPGVQGFWSYLAATAGVPATGHQFGVNPHASLLLT